MFKMYRLIEIASSVIAAAAVLALALGCAIISKPSWAAEPLNSSMLCDDCNQRPFCGPCGCGSCLYNGGANCGCNCNPTSSSIVCYLQCPNSTSYYTCQINPL